MLQRIVPLFVGILLIVNAYKSYDNYKIVRATVASAAEYEAVSDLEEADLLEILSESHSGSLDLLIAPQNIVLAKVQLRIGGIQYKVLMEDVGESVRQERQQFLSAAPLAVGDFDYISYHSLSEMYAHLDKLAADHPNMAETFDLPGTTYSGNHIQAIRITKNIADAGSADKPLLWLDGGIHAREWVSPATVMYIIDTLLGEQPDEADKAAEIDELLTTYQFIIAPDINPDGYEYSREHDRLWRKTRKPSGCKYNMKSWWGGCYYKMCYGVDPNRNWSADWGGTGVSTNPCSQVYPGAKAFDQENTRIVKEYLESMQSKLKLYVTYHSYSQLFLTPLGYTTEPPADADHHLVVGKAVVDAIQARHGVQYVNQQSASLYPASGDSADWAYEVLGLADSYTFELRDTGRYGFELPTDQIKPTGEENVDGLLALIANIKFNQS